MILMALPQLHQQTLCCTKEHMTTSRFLEIRPSDKVKIITLVFWYCYYLSKVVPEAKMTLSDCNNFFTSERSLNVKSTCEILCRSLERFVCEIQAREVFVSKGCLAEKTRTTCWQNSSFVYVNASSELQVRCSSGVAQINQHIKAG